MKTVIVMKADLSIASKYDGEPRQGEYGGPWGSSMMTEHILVPEELDHECVKAEMQDDQIILVEDADKKAAKLQKQREDKLEQIRKLRDVKLVKVDQMVNIAVLEDHTVEQKLALKQYRQELLDLTEAYKADMALLDEVVVEELVLPIEPI